MKICEGVEVDLLLFLTVTLHKPVAYPGTLFGGVSTNSVEDRENGDLGAVAL
jgi:hypothetical protein